MKGSTIAIIILALVIIGGGLWWYASQHMSPASTTTTPAQTTATVNPSAGGIVTITSTTTTTASTTGTPAPQHFTVNGNDETADLKTITVPKGTPVSITFGADAGTTYHGGLDFRSSVVSTGTITPGSTKTVSFTATQSFAFTPYWPATNIAKPYTINVVVQ